MLKLSVSQVIAKIKKGEVFDCTVEDGSFSLHISEYVPYVCAAIHNGSNFRKSLRANCVLSKQERWYEEDPLTGDFISSLPIRIIGNDSRYEYDLNRPLDNCVYDEAWGKKIWKHPLSIEEKEVSFEKHANFYKVIDALIGVLEKKYKACVVFDIHSYNFKRIDHVEAPMFNVGTANVDEAFRPFVNDWLTRLSKMKSDFFENQTHENLVFQGNGHFLKHISKKYKNTLVLATEVRKSYCDEENGDIYHEVVEDLKNGFKKSILGTAKYFISKRANVRIKKIAHLLASNIEPLALSIDSKLYKSLRKFEILEFVNPKNLESEKKKFFNSKFRRNPSFSYRPLKVDVSEFKKDFYNLPIDSLNDQTLKIIFKGIIDASCDQMEMLSYRGDNKFKYMSLKYFGEPDEADLKLAKYLLGLPSREFDQELIPSEASIEYIKKEISQYGFNGNVEFVKNIPSHALFLPSRNLLKVKSSEKFTEKFVNGLCHHEIGVHMLTTENARCQSLRIFENGLPLNTLTQEGIAIVSEYYSGSLSIDRLKELALRVVAVSHMLKNYDFKETFHYLVERYGVDTTRAFYLTARIYRGGGFTKDYLYLRGFRKILELVKNDVDISPLLIGKTSVEYFAEIKELIERGILSPPKYMTRSLVQKNNKDDEILNYILSDL